jgi:quinol monooxygenase YgiN
MGRLFRQSRRCYSQESLELRRSDVMRVQRTSQDRPSRCSSYTEICESVLHRRHIVVKVALFVRLEAKPGKEQEVESFLISGLPLVLEEPATTAWFGIRLGPSTFGIFDAFPDEAGRQAHLTGKVAAALMANASDLFASPPSIEKLDILAAKLPG